MCVPGICGVCEFMVRVVCGMCICVCFLCGVYVWCVSCVFVLCVWFVYVCCVICLFVCGLYVCGVCLCGVCDLVYVWCVCLL